MGNPLSPVQPVVPPAPGPAADPAIRRTAQQFEAMFMTEMLRQARPQSHAGGRFATGEGEKTFSVFMDQALGEAAAAKGTSGLRPAIEQALTAAQKKGGK